MTAFLIQNAFFYGLLMSLILAAIVIASAVKNPAVGLKDYPPAQRQKITRQPHPDTPRHRYLFGIPFLLVVAGALLLALAQLPRLAGGDPTFLHAFLTALIMLMTFNLVDLLVVDLLLGPRLTPKGLPAPDPAYFLTAFLRTTLMMVLYSVAFAAFAMAIYQVI